MSDLNSSRPQAASRYWSGWMLLAAWALSLLTTRGRMGADDLEVYALAKQFPVLGGALFDLLQSSSVSTIPHRWLWLAIDQGVIALSTLIGSPRLMGYDLDYLVCSLLPAVAMWSAFLLLSERFGRGRERVLGLDPVMVLVFFGTVMLHFFNGSTVEAYLVLLFALRVSLGPSPPQRRALWIDMLIVGFKPYYAIVVLGLLFHGAPLRGRVFRVGLHLAACLTLPVSIQIIFRLRGFSYGGLPWDFSFASIFTNWVSMNVGWGFGLLWCYLPAIVLIIVGFRPSRSFLLRMASILGLELFLSTLPYWHGGAPGNRYLSPLLLLFIPELRAGWSRLARWNWHALATGAFACLVITLPVLEYKNVAFREYQSGSVLSGQAHGYPDADRAFFPVNSLAFNPIVFANSVLLAKLDSDASSTVTVGGLRMPVAQIYPGTLPARLQYLANLRMDGPVVPAEIAARLSLLGRLGALALVGMYSFAITLGALVLWRGAREAARDAARGTETRSVGGLKVWPTN